MLIRQVGESAHMISMTMRQPVMEKCLRDKINKSDVSEVRTGCKVIGIEEHGECVYATYEDQTGTTKKIRGKFLAGADGKVGYTRKMYLEPRGVQLEHTSKSVKVPLEEFVDELT